MDSKSFIAYKDSSIIFKKDEDGDIHGVYYTYLNGVDDREDFYIYKNKDGCVTDYVIQGIYVGSLITNDEADVFKILKNKGWEQNLIQLER